MVCCSLMPTLNSTGNTRRGLPSLISSGRIWKTSRGNGTCTVKWSLNVGKGQKNRIRHDHAQCIPFSVQLEKLDNLILGGERARCVSAADMFWVSDLFLTDLLQRFDWWILWHQQTALVLAWSYCFSTQCPKLMEHFPPLCQEIATVLDVITAHCSGEFDGVTIFWAAFPINKCVWIKLSQHNKQWHTDTILFFFLSNSYMLHHFVASCFGRGDNWKNSGERYLIMC